MMRAFRLAIVMALAAAGAQPALAEGGARPTARLVWTDPATNLLGTPSLDGRFLSFVDVDTGDLAVRNLVTGEKRRLTHQVAGSKEFAYFSTISPDSRQVAYAWFNEEKFYDLRVVDLEPGAEDDATTAEPQILYRNPEAGFVQPCAWSPDGKQILTLFFRKDNISQIALVSAADGSVRVLKSLNWVYPKKMDFSPDGRYIVYDTTVSEEHDARDIFVLSTDGSRESALLDDPSNDIFPVWTPDGNHILFASNRSGTMDAWIVPVADGKPQGAPKLIKKNLGRFLPMGITREGGYYYGLRTGTTDIYTASLDLEKGKLLRKPELASRYLVGGNNAPDWSPDGSRLAYLSRRGTENFGLDWRVISVAFLETGQRRTLAPKLAYMERLRWSPDGGSLLVSGSDGKGRAGLFRVDVATGEMVPIVRERSTNFRGFEGVWSADGKAVYYIYGDEQKGFEIRYRDLESRDEHTFYRPSLPSRLHQLALSPDGKSLAFASNQGNLSQASVLLVMPAAGGEPRQLLRARNGELSGVEWSRDSRTLLVSTPGKPAPALWSVSVEGGDPQKLELSLDRQGGIRLHPDGRRIAFTAGQPRSEVWVLENVLPELQASH